MRQFGYETLPDELNGPMVHRLENVMTMDCSLHAAFNRLSIWLVPTVRLC